MLLINTVRALLIGLVAILLHAIDLSFAIELTLAVVLLIVAFTLGDLAEQKLIERFNREP